MQYLPPGQTTQNVYAGAQSSKINSSDPNAPIEVLGEWYVYKSEKGIPYYYHSRTKETRWERPVVPVPQMVIGPPGSYPQAYGVPFQPGVNSAEVDPQTVFQAPSPPSDFSYSSTVLNLNAGERLVALKPSFTSGVSPTQAAYSVTPNLPDGITIDSTGVIWGTPTKVSPAKSYTIQVANSAGSATTTIQITVNPFETVNNTPLLPEKKVYHTKNEAEKEFMELLESVEVEISESWGSIVQKIKFDERYLALHSDSERKRVLKRYKDLVSKRGALKAKRTVRRNAEAMEEFQNLCKEKLTDLFFAECLWNEEKCLEEGTKKVSSDERWIGLDKGESAKKELLHAYVRFKLAEHKKKVDEDTAWKKKQKEALELQQKEAIELQLQKADKEEKEKEEKRLWVEQKEQENQKRRESRRKETMKTRFTKLLRRLSYDHKSDPVIHAKTTIEEFQAIEEVTNDETYKEWIKKEEAVVLEMFDDFCIDMEDRLSEDKKILKKFLKTHRVLIKCEDTVPKLMEKYKNHSRLTKITTSHLQLLFKETIGKQIHKAKKNKEKMARSKTSSPKQMPSKPESIVPEDSSIIAVTNLPKAEADAKDPSHTEHTAPQEAKTTKNSEQAATGEGSEGKSEIPETSQSSQPNASIAAKTTSRDDEPIVKDVDEEKAKSAKDRGSPVATNVVHRTVSIVIKRQDERSPVPPSNKETSLTEASITLSKHEESWKQQISKPQNLPIPVEAEKLHLEKTSGKIEGKPAPTTDEKHSIDSESPPKRKAPSISVEEGTLTVEEPAGKTSMPTKDTSMNRSPVSHKSAEVASEQMEIGISGEKTVGEGALLRKNESSSKKGDDALVPASSIKESLPREAVSEGEKEEFRRSSSAARSVKSRTSVERRASSSSAEDNINRSDNATDEPIVTRSPTKDTSRKSRGKKKDDTRSPSNIPTTPEYKRVAKSKDKRRRKVSVTKSSTSRARRRRRSSEPSCVRSSRSIKRHSKRKSSRSSSESESKRKKKKKRLKKKKRTYRDRKRSSRRRDRSYIKLDSVTLVTCRRRGSKSRSGKRRRRRKRSWTRSYSVPRRRKRRRSRSKSTRSPPKKRRRSAPRRKSTSLLNRGKTAANVWRRAPGEERPLKRTMYSEQAFSAVASSFDRKMYGPARRNDVAATSGKWERGFSPSTGIRKTSAIGNTSVRELVRPTKPSVKEKEESSYSETEDKKSEVSLQKTEEQQSSNSEPSPKRNIRRWRTNSRSPASSTEEKPLVKLRTEGLGDGKDGSSVEKTDDAAGSRISLAQQPLVQKKKKGKLEAVRRRRVVQEISSQVEKEEVRISVKKKRKTPNFVVELKKRGSEKRKVILDHSREVSLKGLGISIFESDLSADEKPIIKTASSDRPRKRRKVSLIDDDDDVEPGSPRKSYTLSQRMRSDVMVEQSRNEPVVTGSSDRDVVWPKAKKASSAEEERNKHQEEEGEEDEWSEVEQVNKRERDLRLRALATIRLTSLKKHLASNKPEPMRSFPTDPKPRYSSVDLSLPRTISVSPRELSRDRWRNPMVEEKWERARPVEEIVRTDRPIHIRPLRACIVPPVTTSRRRIASPRKVSRKKVATRSSSRSSSSRSNSGSRSRSSSASSARSQSSD